MTVDDHFIVNTEKFISSNIGDEIILMNLETGNYVALNIVSADIWKQAEKETSGQTIINYLLQQYNVEEETCRAQTMTCIEDMLEKGLLCKI